MVVSGITVMPCPMYVTAPSTAVDHPCRLGRRPVAIDLDLVTALVGRGANQAEVARACGISVRTLCRRLQSSPELRQAVRDGHAEVATVASSALIQLAEAGDWRAIRLLTLRTLGWLDAGFGTRGVAGMNAKLRETWRRL